MNVDAFVSRSAGELPSRTKRWGVGLAALVIAYVAAVIVFIIIY